MICFIATALSAFAGSGVVVVDLQDNLGSSAMTDILTTTPGALSGDYTDITTVDEGIGTIYTTDLETTLAALASNPLVEVAESNGTYKALGEAFAGAPNDPDYAKQWHMNHSSMSSEWVWENTKSGDGVRVAVLDTGLTITKDINAFNVEKGKSFYGAIKDMQGHGTHCASTIAEMTNNGIGATGLAYNATLVPVKVLDDSGSGSYDIVAAGIAWAGENNVDVISMSLGGGSSSKVINKAIDAAIANGVVVVAAAGNDGCKNCVGYPAGYPPVIAIGAIGPDDKRSYYSSYGKNLDLMAPGGNKQIPGGGVWQITAPGGDEGLYEWQGTSMATPHAAAAAAVLLGEGYCKRGTHGTPQECMEHLLVASATPNENTDEYGKGTINLRKALGGSNETVASTSVGVSTVARAVEHLHSPAGVLSLVVTALSGLLVWLFNQAYKFKPLAFGTSGVVSVLFSGGLWFLTLLPFQVPVISMFMVHWYEYPEHLLGAGASGFPLWQSALPLAIPFILLTPFRWLRPTIIGLCASGFSYLMLNSLLGFNPIWVVSPMGSTIWLGINSLVLLAFMFTASEFTKIQETK